MNRRLLFIVGGPALTLALVWACAPATRYRVLTFFFDGVPAPGAPPKRVETGPGLLTAPPPAERKPAPTVYVHPPYRDNQCRDCHDPNGRWLVRTPEEGLCQRCHPDVPGPQPYLHGPAAANACLSCHHYHESPYPWMLLTDPKDICYRCHKRSDLTTGPSHADLDERPCLDCHDPHGGADKYFLRRHEP
jgi:predicted CXXCH cytochrome family protein